MAILLHTKFIYLASIAFKTLGVQIFSKRQMDRRTGRKTKMVCIMYTLQSIHKPSFINLTFKSFKAIAGSRFLVKDRTDR